MQAVIDFFQPEIQAAGDDVEAVAQPLFEYAHQAFHFWALVETDDVQIDPIAAL